MDPDVLSLIREFKDNRGPARGVSVSLRGFRDKYNLRDDIQFADYSTRELQDRATPEQVLEILREGNRRFRTGNRLSRDFGRQVDACIDDAEFEPFRRMDQTEKEIFVDEIARRNVRRTVHEITQRSAVIRQAVAQGKALVVGALYDVRSGEIEFLLEETSPTR